MSLLEAYERIEQHRAARTKLNEAPPTLANVQPDGHHGAVSENVNVHPDPLADLLTAPIRNLTTPLAVTSSVLGETIFLCANDSQAATVRATGGIPYTPEEIDILLELHQAVTRCGASG